MSSICEGSTVTSGPHRGAKIGPRVMEVKPPVHVINGWRWDITVYHEIEGKFPGVYDARLHLYGVMNIASRKRKAWKQLRAALESESTRG